MSFRVCIPVAGIGSRLGGKTHFINKALVTVSNRPVLSHLIDQFPEDVEFVLALGYKGHLIREFLALAYPHRIFLFADVDVYEGPGSGLGLSLLKCQHHLQQPFVFISCDTLVKNTIPDPEYNWMGYADITEASQYRSLEIRGHNVSAICEKGEIVSAENKPYIGLAGIKDYQLFWQAMQSGGATAIAQGEAYGMRALISRDIQAHVFSWFDTGNPDSLEKTKIAYTVPNHLNILEKENEAIWFIADNVIKFSDDTSFIKNRVKRAQDLKGYAPEITASQPHLYRYTKVEGDVLSDVVTVPLFKKLLEHCKGFWASNHLSLAEQSEFESHCRHFYRDKTLERVARFSEIYNKQDAVEVINGVTIPRLYQLLDQLDWNWLSQGVPCRFHGDLHFENILWNENDQRFTFLDWRQDFDGLLHVGDVYYDLAKLLHGLIINHGIIAQNRFNVSWDGEKVQFEFDRTQVLMDCEEYFYDWLSQNHYDLGKVRLLTALIFLNISPLHHTPYCFLLYALGKAMLFECLQRQSAPVI